MRITNATVITIEDGTLTVEDKELDTPPMVMITGERYTALLAELRSLANLIEPLVPGRAIYIRGLVEGKYP